MYRTEQHNGDKHNLTQGPSQATEAATTWLCAEALKLAHSEFVSTGYSKSKPHQAFH